MGGQEYLRDGDPGVTGDVLVQAGGGRGKVF